MPNLGTFVQKPPRVQALQWTGDPDDAAWVVEQYGGTMTYDEQTGELQFTFPGLETVVVEHGEWFVPDPMAGITRYSDEDFTRSWEPVTQSRA